MSRKDADQLRRALVKHLRRSDSDLRIEKRGGHWHVVTPAGTSLYNFAGTPSDARFKRNTIADLRRLGIVPPGWNG